MYVTQANYKLTWNLLGLEIINSMEFSVLGETVIFRHFFHSFWSSVFLYYNASLLSLLQGLDPKEGEGVWEGIKSAFNKIWSRWLPRNSTCQSNMRSQGEMFEFDSNTVNLPAHFQQSINQCSGVCRVLLKALDKLPHNITKEFLLVGINRCWAQLGIIFAPATREGLKWAWEGPKTYLCPRT